MGCPSIGVREPAEGFCHWRGTDLGDECFNITGRGARLVGSECREENQRIGYITLKISRREMLTRKLEMGGGEKVCRKGKKWNRSTGKEI